jgi:hypothetical protein
MARAMNNGIVRSLAAAAVAVASLIGMAMAPSAHAQGVDYLPVTDKVPAYSSFEAVSDPGINASNYFKPYWYAKNTTGEGGTHIQAHGGQVVKVDKDGKNVYYWYGEDRSNGYDNSPGIHAYRSEDLYNWTDLGVALRSVTSKAELTDVHNPNFSYFNQAYGLTKSDGSVDTQKADGIFPYLNTNNDQNGDGKPDSLQAIFERPKIIYNQKNKEFVLWWHSDGSTTPGGSNYARALAGVAVSTNPAGPFTMVGAYRLPNRADWYTGGCKPGWGEDGDSRDMTVFTDSDGSAYILYSSEGNQSLYVAKLNDDYTNVDKTTTVDQSQGHKQYSADGRYPYILADGTPDAPVRGKDFQIVKECGSLEAPAVFEYDGRYNIVASGATGWNPNKQTYYTASSMLGTWIRGVQANDSYENTWYNNLPEGADGLLSVGDSRGTTFGSQTASVLPVDQAKGEFVYMGDRWDAGKADSTYVWLPLTIGENESIELHNPASEGESNGWNLNYWDSHGGSKSGVAYWKVVSDPVPQSADMGASVALPGKVTVQEGRPGSAGSGQSSVAVTWSSAGATAGSAGELAFNSPGTYTVVGTLASDANFNPGRTFRRTVTVSCSTPVSAPWNEAHWKGGSACQTTSGSGIYSFTMTDNSDNGVWTTSNEASTVYQRKSLGVGDGVETTVKPLDLGGNSDPRAGLVVRNDLSSANPSGGYADLLASPSGIYMQYDSDGNGYVDRQTLSVGQGFSRSVSLKIERSGADEITGYYRDSPKDPWTQVARVPLAGAESGELDSGVFLTANNNAGNFTALFSNTDFVNQLAPVESITAQGKGDVIRGAAFDAHSVTVTATLKNGRTRILDPTEYSVTGVDTSNAGDQKATITLKSDESITAQLPVHIVLDLARAFCSAASSSSYEAGSSQGDQVVQRTCDGDPNTNWSNWNTADTDPWLGYRFDRPYRLGKIDLYVDSSWGEAAPSQFTISYLDADGTTWRQSSLPAVSVDPQKGSQTAVDVSSLPVTQGIRLNLTYGSGYNYAKVAQVNIYPVNDAVPTLSDLTVDGDTVKGFDAGRTSYSGALAGDAQSYPKVAAVAEGEGVGLRVEQADASNGGRATVTLTSPNATASNRYVVDFGALPCLAELRVAVLRPDVALGSRLDSSDIGITAVYRSGAGISMLKPISLQDKDLKITGFDSTTVGRKRVTATYKGVSAAFVIDVVSRPAANSGSTAPAPAAGSPSGSSPLVDTGSSVLGPIAVALALCMVAAAVLYVRRGSHRG